MNEQKIKDLIEKNVPKEPFYKKTWFSVLMLFLFFPVGLFTMWKYTNWKKSIKIIVSVFLFIIIFAAGYSTGDIESPKITMKDSVTFQLNDSITDEMILDKADARANDNQTESKNIELFIKKHDEINTSQVGESKVEICAKDEAENKKCDKTTIIISDSDKKQAEQEKAEQEKAEQEKAEQEKAEQEKAEQEKVEQEIQQQAQAKQKTQQQTEQDSNATALCNDGTYSYAAHHQGACSHHGGVTTFYK